MSNNLQSLKESIITDLGDNFKSGDESLIKQLLEEVLNDALIISNRDKLYVNETDETDSTQIKVLSSNIRKAVKTIYLQRGAEDVVSNSVSGLSNSYDAAIETMSKDIIRQGKRIIR